MKDSSATLQESHVASVVDTDDERQIQSTHKIVATKASQSLKQTRKQLKEKIHEGLEMFKEYNSFSRKTKKEIDDAREKEQSNIKPPGVSSKTQVQKGPSQ